MSKIPLTVHEWIGAMRIAAHCNILIGGRLNDITDYLLALSDRSVHFSVDRPIAFETAAIDFGYSPESAKFLSFKILEVFSFLKINLQNLDFDEILGIYHNLSK